MRAAHTGGGDGAYFPDQTAALARAVVLYTECGGQDSKASWNEAAL